MSVITLRFYWLAAGLALGLLAGCGGMPFGGAMSRSDAPPGTVLPFGEVAKVCGVSGRALGAEVARSDGRRGYRLYDTAPGSTAARTHYLTGFKDGCARQFTAALALFGTAQVHETTRYNPANKIPYSETDEAYEVVKRQVCGVGRGAFCPEAKAAWMDREAAFLSVYRDFGVSAHWMEIFLHGGRLVAHAVEHE